MKKKVLNKSTSRLNTNMSGTFLDSGDLFVAEPRDAAAHGYMYCRRDVPGFYGLNWTGGGHSIALSSLRRALSSRRSPRRTTGRKSPRRKSKSPTRRASAPVRARSPTRRKSKSPKRRSGSKKVVV